MQKFRITRCALAPHAHARPFSHASSQRASPPSSTPTPSPPSFRIAERAPRLVCKASASLGRRSSLSDATQTRCSTEPCPPHPHPDSLTVLMAQPPPPPATRFLSFLWLFRPTTSVSSRPFRPFGSREWPALRCTSGPQAWAWATLLPWQSATGSPDSSKPLLSHLRFLGGFCLSFQAVRGPAARSVAVSD
jgi:hypothetical protein